MKKMLLEWLEIKGFRAFGLQEQRIEFSPILTIVRAENSQGKTSFSEAMEFLFTGTTSRRDLHNGAKAEFDGCLRNVHLPDGEEVWVQAQFKLLDGSTTVVKRKLLNDYNGAVDCTSELTQDGDIIEHINAIGLEMSGHTLSAPVLQQHVLDFVAAAAPQERANYFKALLDLKDLEEVRSYLTDHISTLDFEPPELIKNLLGISKKSEYNSLVRQILSSSNYQLLESHLIKTGNFALAETGHKQAYDDLAQVTENLEKIVESRLAKIISLKDISLVKLPIIEAYDLEAAVEDYSLASKKIDEQVTRLVPIFKSVLEIPEISHAEHESESANCPVCGSSKTLTPARIEILRKQLEDNSSFNGKAIVTENSLYKISSTLTSARTSVSNSTPAIVDWDDKQKKEFKDKALALSIPKELIDQVLDGASTIGAELNILHKDMGDVRKEVSDTIDAIKERKRIDSANIKAANIDLKKILKRYTIQKSTIETQLVSHEQLQISVNKRAEEQSGTKTWSEILSVCKQPDEVLQAILEGRSLKTTKARFEKASEEIDKAVIEVFIAKFSQMSDEVVAWWETLRPNELTSFEGVKMRGSGKRWFDLKAQLKTSSGSSGIQKDAVSVFSNSQLNALGLSSFLARCSMQNTPFVVLDDPIPSGDTEHRLTFATNTVSRLLDSFKTQTIITVYDTLTAQQINDAQLHRGIKYYEVTLENPLSGSELKPVSDEFHTRLATASTLMHNPNNDVRKLAGQNLRDAAERLAKQIVVAGIKAGGQTASIADYDRKTLGELKPLVAPYHAEAREAGLWVVLARELNPADHDTNPPAPTTLKQCHDTLKEINKMHPEAKGVRR